MIIAKFGGTSVSTKDRIQTICDIIRSEQKRKPVVVVSAIRGVTDLLLSLHSASREEQKNILSTIEQIHSDLIRSYWQNPPLDFSWYMKRCIREITALLGRKRYSAALQDRIVSYGEIMSSFIISKALSFAGIPAQQVVATKLIVTDNNFGSAEFLPKETRQKTKKTLIPFIEKGIVPVVTGFIGSSISGKVTTLGRGGSDYSAAILGYALRADEIQIWTDVDGILTSDPRVVENTEVLSIVSYREASELAAFGAKVLHPRTIRPAISAGIPVRVLNTLRPTAKGTRIEEKSVKQRHIAAIAAKRKITLVNLYSTDMLLSKGFLARVFSIFAKHNISVDLVSVSEVSVSVSLDNDEDLQKVVTELKEFTQVTVSQSFGMVSLIGEGIVGIQNIMKNIFSVLDRLNIMVKMISLGATDINISLVLASSQVDEAVAVLHKEMILKKGKTK
ncbi:MAG: aspartate kinase [bacterium]|nr:aspartate kinase [bacterium]